MTNQICASGVHFEEDETFAQYDELDSDVDELDPGAQLGQWLDQLQVLSEGLTGMQSLTTSSSSRPVLDSYRYSEANLEESADVDLDALIGELCALESQLNSSEQPTVAGRMAGKVPEASSGGAGSDISQLARVLPKARCRSPDTDSAYCETISVLSESTQSSCHRSGGSSIDSTRDSMTTPSPTQLMEVVQAKIRTAKEEMRRENLGEAEVQMRLKNEKIKIALEKMKEASVKKLYVKVFTKDGSSKNILIDERWTVSYVLRQLAEKCQVPLSRCHAIVEYYPDLFMERVYEDHELLVENILMWTENSPNRLLFTELPSKYDIFDRPEACLLDHTHSDRNSVFSPEARRQLIEEFFSPSSIQPPEIAGPLFLKQDDKKSWRKFMFVLRGSGLYYVPRGRGKSSRDLVCLTNFDTVQVYKAVDWKKKYKAPTAWGFAVKHPRIQVKASKYIKYLCAEDEATCLRWMAGIRIAKNGHQLMKNWENMNASTTEPVAGIPSSSAKCSLESLNTVSGKEANAWSTSSVDASGTWLNYADNSEPLKSRIKNAGSVNVDNTKRASRTLVPVDTPTVSFKDDIRLANGHCGSSASIPKTGIVSDTRSLRSSSDFSDRVEQVSLNAFEMDCCTGTVKRQASKCASGAAKIPLTEATRQQLAFSRMADQNMISQQQQPSPLVLSVNHETGGEHEMDSDEELPPPPPPLYDPRGAEKFAPPPLPLTTPTQQLNENGAVEVTNSSKASTVKARGAKLPPPPPPKRSEATRLSCAVQGAQLPKANFQSTTGIPMMNGNNEVDNFHAELQMAMQKRLRKLETAENGKNR